MPNPALVFDIDGTFAETEEVHRQAFNETFAMFNLQWHWDRPLYKKLLEVTGGKERMRHYVKGWSPPDGDRALNLVPEIHAVKTERYTALIDSGAALARPGVLRLIHEARRLGLPVAIATTTSMPNVESLVRATLGPDGMGLFEAVGAGDMVPHKKPAADIYHYVLEALGIGGGDAIAFEDSANGLASARAAGIATIVTPSVYTDDQRFDGALAVLSDLGEPGRPYQHIAGMGADRGMVAADILAPWLARAKP